MQADLKRKENLVAFEVIDSERVGSEERLQERGVLLGAVVGIFGVLVLFRKLYPWKGELWADDFDSNLIQWILEWGYHCIIEKGQPLAIWHANSFFPHSNSLAFSDSLLGAQIFYIPARLLGLAPLSALYATLAGASVVGCILSSVALRRIGIFSVAERALILVTSHFGLPMTAFLGHYQLFGFHFAIPFLLFTFLYARRLQWFDCTGALICISIGVTFSSYLAPMGAVLCLALIPLASRTIWRQIRGDGRKGSRRLLGHLVVTAMVGLTVFFIQLRPYLDHQREFGGPTLEEAASYAATPRSLVVGASVHSLWYSPGGYAVWGEWERAYFPGVVLLFGSVAGAYVLVLLTARCGHWVGKNERHNEVIIVGVFSVVLLLTLVVLSWGPYWGKGGPALPFYYLSKVIPGLQSVRNPGRFGMLLGLPMGILLAIAVAMFRNLRLYRVALIMVIIAATVDAFPSHAVHPSPKYDFSMARMIEEAVPASEPVVVLPLNSGDHLSTIRTVMRQLTEGFVHWRKMVVGYGNKSTPELDALIGLDGLIRAGNSAAVEDLKTFLRTNRISYIAVNKGLYPKSSSTVLSELFAAHSMTLLKRDEGGNEVYSVNMADR